MYTNIKNAKKDGNDTYYTMARTTIELDADIITIIPKDLLIDNNSNNHKLLLNLHKCNIHLSNYLFLYPLFRIIIAIKTVKYALSLLPAPIYVILYSILSGKTISESTLYELIAFITSSICIPAILFRVISKNIFPFILNKLLGQIK